MKWYFLIIIGIWLARIVFRATGNYQVIRRPNTSIQIISKKDWTPCFIGRYGVCNMYIEKEKKQLQVKGKPQFKYKIKRLPF